MRILMKNTNDTGFRWITAPNELHTLQELVGGGHIEAVTLATDAVLICNEEGVFKDMLPNCSYMGLNFVGPILLVGTDGEEFTDCPWSVTIANKGIKPFRG